MENHIHFDAATQYGALLRSALTVNEQADEKLADVRDMLIQMLDGDGSADSHYGTIVRRLHVAAAGEEPYTSTQGAPSAGQLAKAHALFLEIDSAYSKTSGNGSVDNVRAARDQLFNKLRGQAE